MEVLKEFFTNMDGKVEGFIKPIVDWILAFFAKEPYFVFMVAGAFVAILVLAGLIGMLKKAKGLFFLLLIIVAAVVCVWYFFVN